VVNVGESLVVALLHSKHLDYPKGTHKGHPYDTEETRRSLLKMKRINTVK